jgi:hypothetical protein
MTFSECVQQLNDYLIRGMIIAAGSRTRIYVHRKHARSWLIYSIRFRQHDNNNNLESLLTSALVDSTQTTTTTDFETTQDDRQLKHLNFLNNENQVISDQFEVRKVYKIDIDSGRIHRIGSDNIFLIMNNCFGVLETFIVTPPPP